MQLNRNRTAGKPLDQATLERLALHYVGRYATTCAKLAVYLRRKVQERGWSGGAAADVDAIVRRCADLGYVDDAAFAEMRAGSLSRRGYGARRIDLALRSAGIDAETAATVRPDDEAALTAADTYARRKHIGPYGNGKEDPRLRNKQFAAMVRAGHSIELARKYSNAKSMISAIYDDI